MYGINQDSRDAFDEIERRTREAQHPMDAIFEHNKKLNDGTTEILRRLNGEVNKGPFAGYVTFTGIEPVSNLRAKYRDAPVYDPKTNKYVVTDYMRAYLFAFTVPSGHTFRLKNRTKQYNVYLSLMLLRYATDVNVLMSKLNHH